MNNINRRFYIFAIFVAVLTTLVGSLQSIAYVRFGSELYTKQSYIKWYVLSGVLNLMASACILMYYSFKKFSVVFSVGIIHVFTSILLALVFYQMLLGKPQAIYIPVLFLYFGVGTISALSLIFSRAKERFWLKTAGIVAAIESIILI